MLKLFARRRRPKESAPQLSSFERRAYEAPGPAPGGLPYRTLDEMQRDAMVQTALTIKRLGVTAAPWKLEPGQGERGREAMDLVLAAFERMEGSPLSVLDAAMDAFAKGWSLQEKLYEEEDGRIWLRACRPKDPSLFGLEVDAFGRIERLSLEVPGEATRELDPARFLIYVNRSAYGRPKGRSDLEAAYGHWQAKQALLSAWRSYLDRLGLPTLLGKFDATTSPEDRAALLAALANLHQSKSLVLPKEIEVDSLGGDREPSSTFLEAVEYHNREIARAILGQTLTTDEGRRVGSLALGKVHLQVLLLQLEAIRLELADTVMTEQLIRPLVEMNLGDAPVPRFVFDRVSLGAFSSGVMD